MDKYKVILLNKKLVDDKLKIDEYFDFENFVFKFKVGVKEGYLSYGELIDLCINFIEDKLYFDDYDEFKLNIKYYGVDYDDKKKINFFEIDIIVEDIIN